MPKRQPKRRRLWLGDGAALEVQIEQRYRRAGRSAHRAWPARRTAQRRNLLQPRRGEDRHRLVARSLQPGTAAQQPRISTTPAPKRSRCQPGRSAPLRSASRPGWHRKCGSANHETGPVIAGSPILFRERKAAGQQSRALPSSAPSWASRCTRPTGIRTKMRRTSLNRSN